MLQRRANSQQDESHCMLQRRANETRGTACCRGEPTKQRRANETRGTACCRGEPTRREALHADITVLVKTTENPQLLLNNLVKRTSS